VGSGWYPLSMAKKGHSSWMNGDWAMVNMDV
jgi:hypothetical protein